MWFTRSSIFLALLSSVSVRSTCPPDFIYENVFQKCYAFIGASSSFVVAEQQCNSMGATLVSIQNAFENSYVSGIVATSSDTPTFWIGANLLVSSEWSWTANNSFYYTDWAPSQPADPSPFQCAAIRSYDNLWLKEICNYQMPFVCSVSGIYNIVTTTTLPTPQPTCPYVCSATATCPPDYRLFTGDCKCYMFDVKWRTYSDSKKFCSLDNATLAIITTPEQNEFLVEITGRNFCNDGGCPWIGLQCPDSHPSHCRWQNGDHLSYNNFIKGEPNGDVPSCYMYLFDPVGKWSQPSEDGGMGTTICQTDSFDISHSHVSVPPPSQLKENANARR